MPGKEPTSSTAIRCQSIAPVAQCPIPATSVNGTACAMSEATMREYRQLRIEQQKRGYAHRAGPNRRDRDQHAKCNTHQHGRAGGGAGVDLLQVPAIALHDRLTEDQRHRGEHQRKTEHDIDQAARGFAVEIKLPQHNEREDACRDAAACEPDHCGPMDAPRRPCAAVPAVLVAAANRRSVPTAVAGWTPNRRSTMESSASRRPHPSCQPEGRRRIPRPHKGDRS